MKILIRLFGKNFFPYDKIPEKIKLVNYYVSIFKCQNCNATNNMYIKKGVHVNDVAEHIKCSTCECHLTKKEQK